jgi:membrane-bound serine protease (ClpP class)
MKLKLILVIVVGLLFSLFVTSVSAQKPIIVVATVENEITAGTVQYIKRTIAEAEQVGADLFVLEIDTPGGLLKATEEISRALVDTKVPTAVFVYKETGKALSAGVYILLSADTTAATPNAVIGAATPITGGGDDATEKIINASAEWLGVLASRNDRTVEEIKDFVFNATTMATNEANEKGIIDVIAISTRDMVEQLGYEDPLFTFLKPRWTDSILAFLSLPFLVPLLLSLGAVGIFFLFRTGDIESIGIIGIIFLFLGLWGAGTITISTLGLLLLITGLSLLTVEFLFSPGFGIIGGVGVIALIISTITFANEPLYPNYFNSHLFYSVLGVWAGVALIMGWLGSLSMNALKKPVQVGREVWYGKVIMLESALTPNGRIHLDGDSYLARTIDNTIIDSGKLVTIVKIEGNTILVTLATK